MASPNKIYNTVAEAQESADNITPSAEQIKAAALNKCRGAVDSIRGSGQITTELKKTADSLIGIPAEAAAGGLKACVQLLSFQPIKATCTVAKGLTGVLENVAKVATAPIPVALAAAGQSYNAAKSAGQTVVSLPKKTVLKAYDVTDRGLNKVLDLFGPSESSAPSKSKDPGPPPADAPQAA